MKTNNFTALLVGVLICLSVVAAWVSVRYYFSLKQLHKLQGQYIRMNQTMTVLRSLTADCVRYGRVHPELQPILQRYDLVVSANTNAAPNPAPDSLPELNP